ncbi:MAG: alpha-L-fucosidase [Pyrinomonadaceae bacterium]
MNQPLLLFDKQSFKEADMMPRQSLCLFIKRPLSVALLFCIVTLAPGAFGQQQSAYQPTPANVKARQWFQDAKFGLFVHWGVYSVLGDGEWVMNNRKIPAADYEKLPAQFNPVEFDAAEWVSLVKAAGMKYITITSKHHDGFAMFDSKLTDWDIVDRTPYKKDVIKLLADECRRRESSFFLSLAARLASSGLLPARQHRARRRAPGRRRWFKYLVYGLSAQELLTNYGEIGIWFDGMWDRPQADWRIARTYKLIHDLQPQTLVGSNHHLKPFAGEDFQMFEKDLPGKNTAGFSKESVIGDLPLETCETMNNSWGFNINDRKYKSTRELIHYLVRAAGHNANFLLNVGPMPNGKIQPEFAARLREVGQWMAKHGEAIYGTRSGPVEPRNWGVTTQKGNRIYVHILDWQDSVIALPQLKQRSPPPSFSKTTLSRVHPKRLRHAHQNPTASDG